MSKNRILIHIHGGLVQQVFADNPNDVEVIIRDADTEGNEKDYAEEGNLFESEGYRYLEREECIYHWSALETQPFANPVKPEDV